jgi:RNA polymerase sigma-70 factor, ECF subfamily
MSFPEMEEEHALWLEGLRSGNEKIFQDIFNAYYEPLCRFSLNRIESKEEAEEIVQDVFVKLWIKREDLVIQQSLKSYLYRMVQNRIINRSEHRKIRKIHQQHVLSNPPEHFASENDFHEEELNNLAAKAEKTMPEKRRQVYELSRKKGLKYSEIAEKMGISIKTVEVHLSKALDHMRVYLKDYLVALAYLFYNRFFE